MEDVSNLNYIAIGVSVLSLLFSVTALYIVNFWEGKINSTAPSQITLGISNIGPRRPFIIIESFFYTQSLQGKVIESLYAEVLFKEKSQKFNSWMAGNSSTQNRIRMSGIRVNRSGVNLSSIFFPPHPDWGFTFPKGECTLKLFARTTGKSDYIELNKIDINLTESQSDEIENSKLAVFEISSNGKDYHVYMDNHAENMNEEAMKFMKSVSALTDSRIKNTSEETNQSP